MRLLMCAPTEKTALKNVIVFQDSFTYKFKIYVLNDIGTYYLLPNDQSKGFNIQKVIDHQHGFKFFDTVQEAEMYLLEQSHGVTKEDPDFICPKCERGYLAKEHDTPDDYEYNKKCVCGHTIKVNVEFSVKYNVN